MTTRICRRLQRGRHRPSCWTRSRATISAGRAAMAPVIMGNADRPELGQELTESFCRTDPAIARQLRPRHLPVRQPRRPAPRSTSPTLVLQCTNDVIAPVAVGEYVARRRCPMRTMVLLDATGHCPNLSAPERRPQAIAAPSCAVADPAASRRLTAEEARGREAASTRRCSTTTPTSSTSRRPAATCPPRPTAPSSRSTRPSCA